MTQLTLAYTCVGAADAPALVLGNSLGTTTAMWDAQLESFLQDFRVVRWDLPGHGASPQPSVPVTIAALATAVTGILDELGLAQVSYCGISLGAMVGMSVAAQNADRVQRLALCCTSAHLTPASAWRERAATVRAHGMEAIAPTVISRWFTPDFRARQPALVERMTAAFVETNEEGYARCCEAIAAMDLRASLALIRCPTLIVTGADDVAIPPAHGADIAAAVAGSQLVCVERAAHLATIERADTITPLLLEHLGTSRHILGTSGRNWMHSDTYDNGMSVRREVLGDAHVDRAIASSDEFTADFQALLTRYAWGGVWSRPDLDRRTRSCVTIALLAALGCEEEFRMHLGAATRNGVTHDEIKEVLLHVAVYAGAPRANRAFAIAQAAFRDAADAG